MPIARQRPQTRSFPASLALLCLCAIAAPTRAQGSAEYRGGAPLLLPATGFTVTGRVLCADTQHAARFALVSLIPAAAVEGEFDRGRRASGRTDLDGNFSIPNVPAGDYYVTGAQSGYINEAQNVSAALNAGSSAALSGVPLAHVSAAGANVLLTLQRGAVVSGLAQWDDGSPAAGVQVAVLPAPTSTAATTNSTPPPAFGGPGFGRGGGQGATTDDRGHYRIAGIPPGSYLLRASVQAPAPARADDRGFTRNLSLSVYAPDKLRRTDAVPFTLTAGEDHGDLPITLKLSSLHTLSGQISAAGAAVHSGTVSVTDTQDPTLSRTGPIAADGTFTVPYVPAGSYTLQVNASAQMPSADFSHIGQDTSSAAGPHFQPLQEALTVADSDLNNLSLTVAPAAPAAQ